MGYFKNKQIQMQDDQAQQLIPDDWQTQQANDYEEMEQEMRDRQHKAMQQLSLSIIEIKSALLVNPNEELRTALLRVKVVYENMFNGNLFNL